MAVATIYAQANWVGAVDTKPLILLRAIPKTLAVDPCDRLIMDEKPTDWFGTAANLSRHKLVWHGKGAERH